MFVVALLRSLILPKKSFLCYMRPLDYPIKCTVSAHILSHFEREPFYFSHMRFATLFHCISFLLAEYENVRLIQYIFVRSAKVYPTSIVCIVMICCDVRYTTADISFFGISFFPISCGTVQYLLHSSIEVLVASSVIS